MRVCALQGLLRRFLAEDDGPSAVEYAILLGLIVVVAVAAISGIGRQMWVLYDVINSAVS